MNPHGLKRVPNDVNGQPPPKKKKSGHEGRQERQLKFEKIEKAQKADRLGNMFRRMEASAQGD